MSFTSRNLVAFALLAIASVVFFSNGCTRDEEAPREAVQQPAEPQKVDEFARMEDPAYRKALDEKIAERKDLSSTRYRLVSQMEAKIADAKARLGTEDEEVLRVELEKDPEWVSLYKRVTDLNTAIEDNRRNASALVRDRIMSDIRRESAEQ